MERDKLQPYNWQEDAACLGEDPLLFDTDRATLTDQELAKQICGACAVRAACLAAALESDEVGIWGGMTAEERQGTKDPFMRVLVGLARDPVVRERAELVLPENSRIMLRQLLYDNNPEPNAPLILDKATDNAQTLLRQAIAANRREAYYRDRQRLIKTGASLLDGNFDYRQWATNPGPSPIRSALLFLARMGEPIPPVADLEELKALARTKVGILRPSKDRLRAALTDYYGLNSAELPSKDQVAETASLKVPDLEKRISAMFMNYRSRRAA